MFDNINPFGQVVVKSIQSKVIAIVYLFWYDTVNVYFKNYDPLAKTGELAVFSKLISEGRVNVKIAPDSTEKGREN